MARNKKYVIAEENIFQSSITGICFIFIIIIVSMALLSCGSIAKQHRSEQKLSKLIKANPQLVKSDTTIKDTIIQQADITGHAVINEDSNKLHHEIEQTTAKFVKDSIAQDSINSEMESIADHAGDIDTTIDDGKAKIHIKKTGTKLVVDTQARPDSVVVAHTTIVNTVRPVPILKWYQRFLLKIGTLGICFLILILLYVIYRIFKSTTK